MQQRVHPHAEKSDNGRRQIETRDDVVHGGVMHQPAKPALAPIILAAISMRNTTVAPSLTPVKIEGSAPGKRTLIKTVKLPLPMDRATLT